MRSTIAALLAATLAACGGSSSTSSAALETQSKNAMPTSDKVKMTAPNSTGSSEVAQGPHHDSTLGGTSDYFNLTVALAATVNVSAAVTLGILATVTTYPATSCDTASNTCTWGPFPGGALDANNYELVVIKQNDGSFKYALSGQSKASATGPFITFLSGTAITSSTPHVGSGELVIDNDARAQLPGGSGDTGKIIIDYQNNTPLTISATATGVKDSSNAGQKLNVGYAYADHADGSGDLDVAFKNLTSNDVLSLHSRWLPTGSGRGDVKYTAGNGSATVTISECWAASSSLFTLTYLIGPAGTSGSVSACAYADASYGSVVAPQ